MFGLNINFKIKKNYKQIRRFKINYKKERIVGVFGTKTKTKWQKNYRKPRVKSHDSPGEVLVSANLGAKSRNAAIKEAQLI